jgi:hypothetical protein
MSTIDSQGRPPEAQPDAHGGTTATARARRIRKALPLIAALALGLALAGCDHCGDFFWQSGACHATPPPH